MEDRFYRSFGQCMTVQIQDIIIGRAELSACGFVRNVLDMNWSKEVRTMLSSSFLRIAFIAVLMIGCKATADVVTVPSSYDQLMVQYSGIGSIKCSNMLMSKTGPVSLDYGDLGGAPCGVNVGGTVTADSYNLVGSTIETLNGATLFATATTFQVIQVFSPDVPIGSVFDAEFVVGGGAAGGEEGGGEITVTGIPQSRRALIGDVNLINTFTLNDTTCDAAASKDIPIYSSTTGVVLLDGISLPCKVVNGGRYDSVLQFQNAAESFSGSNVISFFSDPSVMNIIITDPSTGLPVPGVTVTGDTGTVYPVNVAETPEPRMAPVVLVVILCIIGVRCCLAERMIRKISRCLYSRLQ